MAPSSRSIIGMSLCFILLILGLGGWKTEIIASIPLLKTFKIAENAHGFARHILPIMLPRSSVLFPKPTGPKPIRITDHLESAVNSKVESPHEEQKDVDVEKPHRNHHLRGVTIRDYMNTTWDEAQSHSLKLSNHLKQLEYAGTLWNDTDSFVIPHPSQVTINTAGSKEEAETHVPQLQRQEGDCSNGNFWQIKGINDSRDRYTVISIAGRCCPPVNHSEAMRRAFLLGQPLTMKYMRARARF